MQKEPELSFASIDILRSSTTFENQNLRKKPTPYSVSVDRLSLILNRLLKVSKFQQIKFGL